MGSLIFPGCRYRLPFPIGVLIILFSKNRCPFEKDCLGRPSGRNPFSVSNLFAAISSSRLGMGLKIYGVLKKKYMVMIYTFSRLHQDPCSLFSRRILTNPARFSVANGCLISFHNEIRYRHVNPIRK